ncbi:GGDEF domain-containing protein [Clostridium grantii]|uniref:Diguanylate cyclase (GGDEF) domain-containing protein n=1 Tax=Clostridium grantii DSM 8605 TaxID=1121316 RepID=A0A1M5XI73_9CLOT|nr:GGDEF domain-containing protein [Clostridium grantii]SHH99527.1 diguanylate cyclase (GGDEF) domain-containing protein [Clostridium grantii DSM 8605]
MMKKIEYDKKGFIQDVLKENIYTLHIFFFIIAVSDLIVCLFQLWIQDFNRPINVEYIIQASPIVFGFVEYFRLKKWLKEGQVKNKKSYIYIDIGIIMFWGILATMIDINSSLGLTAHVIMLFVVVEMLYHSPIVSFMISIIPSIILSLLILYFKDNIIYSTINVMVVMGLSFFIWMSSLSKYKLKLQLFIEKKQLEKLSKTDLLTNLYNHTEILNILKTTLIGHIDENYTVGIIMMDIDYFKVVNDQYGHQKGDYILKEVALLIKNIVADMGFVGRYGGEEFLIVLKHLEVEQMIEIGQAIRSKVEGYDFNGIKITISGGFKECNSENFTSAIKDADNNLYKAKTQGRNKVCF